MGQNVRHSVQGKPCAQAAGQRRQGVVQAEPAGDGQAHPTDVLIGEGFKFDPIGAQAQVPGVQIRLPTPLGIGHPDAAAGLDRLAQDGVIYVADTAVAPANQGSVQLFFPHPSHAAGKDHALEFQTVHHGAVQRLWQQGQNDPITMALRHFRQSLLQLFPPVEPGQGRPNLSVQIDMSGGDQPVLSP